MLLRGATQDASQNAYAALEYEIPTGEFPRVDNASVEASLVEAIDAPPLWARQACFAVNGAQSPSTGWSLVRTFSQWSGPGLRRIR